MRVLHLYSGNLYGGVETMLSAFARARVPELEHHFGLAFPAGRLGTELRAADPDSVHPLGAVRLRNPLTVRRARRALRTLLDRLRPDAVICHSAWSQAVFGPVARSSGLPLLFWLHDAAGRTALERIASRTRPDAAVCTSAYVASTLPDLFPGIPCRVIHPAVAAPEPAAERSRTRLRAAAGLAEQDVVLVQVARMEPWKGHGVLLDALGLLAGRPGWHCWMVGGAQRPAEARYRDRLEQRARRLGVASRIAWLGERRDVPEVLAAADVLVQPNSAPEPFGMAMVEALYAGIPVVAADHGGAREVLDDACGVRFAPNDAASLGAAVDALLSDDARRTALGAAGPVRAAALCDPTDRLTELAAMLRPLVERAA